MRSPSACIDTIQESGREECIADDAPVQDSFLLMFGNAILADVSHPQLTSQVCVSTPFAASVGSCVSIVTVVFINQVALESRDSFTGMLRAKVSNLNNVSLDFRAKEKRLGTSRPRWEFQYGRCDRKENRALTVLCGSSLISYAGP